jgi:CHASE3 domain sensor protein
VGGNIVMSTSIGQQLSKSFYTLVGLLGALASVIAISLLFNGSAQSKTAKLFELQRQTADIGSRMMQNRDHLGNYLLTSNERRVEETQCWHLGFQDRARQIHQGCGRCGREKPA